MIKLVSYSVAFALAAAFAFADTPTDSPKMTFRDVKAEPQMSALKDKVTPYRIEDLVLVLIKKSGGLARQLERTASGIGHYRLAAAGHCDDADRQCGGPGDDDASRVWRR